MPGQRVQPRDDGQGGVLLALKAVPGAARDEIVGPLGDRLKVRVSAPAESGRANRAIEALLAERLGIGHRDVSVIAGLGSPFKTARITGIDAGAVLQRLGTLAG